MKGQLDFIILALESHLDFSVTISCGLFGFVFQL